MLTGLREFAPELLHWFLWSYGRTSPLFYQGEHVVDVSTGCKQSVLLPFLCSARCIATSAARRIRGDHWLIQACLEVSVPSSMTRAFFATPGLPIGVLWQSAPCSRLVDWFSRRRSASFCPTRHGLSRRRPELVRRGEERHRHHGQPHLHRALSTGAGLQGHPRRYECDSSPDEAPTLGSFLSVSPPGHREQHGPVHGVWCSDHELHPLPGTAAIHSERGPWRRSLVLSASFHSAGARWPGDTPAVGHRRWDRLSLVPRDFVSLPGVPLPRPYLWDAC